MLPNGSKEGKTNFILDKILQKSNREEFCGSLWTGGNGCFVKKNVDFTDSFRLLFCRGCQKFLVLLWFYESKGAEQDLGVIEDFQFLELP